FFLMSLYSEALKHPKWQRKRLHIFQRDGWMCVKCRNRDRELHAHHTYYMPNRAPWEYPDDSIITLCSDCHYLEHIPTLNPESRPIQHIRYVMIDLIEDLKRHVK